MEKNLIDANEDTSWIEIIKLSSITRFYFSGSLQKKQLEAKVRIILQNLQDAEEIQK
jgi:hypothetical protein